MIDKTVEIQRLALDVRYFCEKNCPLAKKDDNWNHRWTPQVGITTNEGKQVDVFCPQRGCTFCSMELARYMLFEDKESLEKYKKRHSTNYYIDWNDVSFTREWYESRMKEIVINLDYLII